ncbi:MAG: 6-phosphogluconolactonase [Saprospiraceae bacterium]|nr:6-phosphogluconolactonase [Saprospiraceae bacterium]
MIKKISFNVIRCETQEELGRMAGEAAISTILAAIQERGQANIVMATGTAQYATLKYMIADTRIDWSKVVMFHLDEYIGIPGDHKASFRKFLTERFLDHVSPLKKTHLINGFEDADAEIEFLNEEISKHKIDLSLIGIGENGHIAFNDPPADFETESPFIKVALDDKCRMQQVGEGWFNDLDEVPTHAISMSVRHMLKTAKIIASIPDARKALPVSDTVNKAIDPWFPSTYIRKHHDCTLYVDAFSAELL